MGAQFKTMSKNPQCVWAQRDDLVYSTVQQIDLKDEKVDIDFEAGKIVFSAGDYAIDIELFDGLKTEGSKWNNTGREIQFLLMKNEEKWWDRLTKAPTKNYKFIKTDFDKWKDEDEQEEDTQGPGNFGAGGMDFGGMGGGGGMPGGMGGMPGMGGMGGMPGMEGMDMEAMMKQMGGMGGMAGMGGDDGELDSDDEDLPDLEADDDMPALEEDK